VIDAARVAGVGLLGFTSRSLGDIEASQNAMMCDYFETEALIRQSGLRAVIFRNAVYLDTLPVFLGGPRAFHAGIRVPAGQGGRLRGSDTVCGTHLVDDLRKHPASQLSPPPGRR
jgi:NAD(P)H dehydrogenase (quinone)